MATVSTVLVSQRGSECRLCGCSERHRFCVYCGELPHEPVPCAQMMELCKALEELHVELEELPLEQYRARDELPLMQQWARGRADDRVTLSVAWKRWTCSRQQQHTANLESCRTAAVPE